MKTEKQRQVIMDKKLFYRPRLLDFSLFNKFTGDTYVSISNNKYDCSKMANGYYRRQIMRMKQACAESWNVPKRLIKLRLDIKY